MSKNKKLLIAIALMSIMLIAMIVGIMVVLVAGNQNAKVQLKVKYQVSDVYVEISAKAYIGGNVYTLKNGNSDILTLSPVNMNGELNQTEDELVMDRDNSKIIYEYKFTNLSETIPASISQTIENGGVKVPVDTINNNILLTYYSSTAQKYNTITSNKTTLNSQSLLPKTTKYIYVIASIQDLMKDVLFEGEFGWILTKADLVDNTTENISGGTIISGTDDADVVNKDEMDKVNLVLDCENEKPNYYPQKANKCFTGWYTKDESGNDIEVEWPALITSSTNIYPKYENETPGLSYTYTGDGYAIVGGYNGSTSDIFVPDIHNDGTHGNARITSIAGFAFRDNKTIVDVVIPNTVTSIGDSTFANCTNLRSLYIPKSVTSIGSGVFSSCNSITNMIVEVGNPKYDSRYNCNAIIETASNILMYGCQNTVVPEGIVVIGSNAFRGISSLQEINLPYTVKTLGASSLQQTGLTNIVLPNGLTTINGYAFYLTPIEEFYIPASVNYIGSLALCTNRTNSIVVSSANPKYDSRNNCNAVIETATNKLIVGCNKSTIPNTVVSIASYAFQQCKGLKSIHISSSVVEIGQSLFEGCTNLATLTVDESNPKYDSRNNCNAIVETASNTLVQGIATSTIPEGIKAIGDKAFQAVLVSSITLPNSLETIGVQAFYQTPLKSINIPKNVNKIKENVFGYCNNLATITVDAGNSVYDSRDNCNAVIETVTNTLVAGCKNSTIPNTVTAIGYRAFYVIPITTITIPNSVKTIGAESFGFSKLESVVIPNSVTTIGNFAFAYAGQLKSVTIGSGVTTIGNQAFQGCSLLNSVTFSNTTGWKVYSNTNYTDGIDAEVSSTDTFYNSTLFKSIYLNKHWKRG